MHRRFPAWLFVWTGLIVPAAVAAEPAPALPDAEVPELRFSDFFRHPVGPRGLEISDRLRAADGQRVRLVGYVVAPLQSGGFLLAPMPNRPGDVDEDAAGDLPPATVTVLPDAAHAGRTVAPSAGPVALVGRLQLGRSEDAAGRVSWVRLLLDAPDSDRSSPPPATP